MKKRSLHFLCLLLLLSIFPLHPATADTYRIALYPDADTFISARWPSDNYGATTGLMVGRSSNAVPNLLHTRIRFSDIPSGANIQSVYLRLYRTTGSGSHTLSVQSASRSWSENTLTYDSDGSTARWSSPNSTYVMTDQTGYVPAVNVTDHVREWANGTRTNYGFHLSTDGTLGENHTFASRESGIPSYWPKLTITYDRTLIIRLSGDLAFGSVTVGQTSQRTLTIYNDGNSTLTVSGISYPTGFSPSWSGTIGAGGSRNVTVTFAPTAVTSYGGTVTVSSNKTSGTNTISCSGTGTTASTRIIRLSGDLAFGSVTVGQTSQRTLTIYNDGNSTLTVSGISYPTGFSPSWSGTISAGGSRNVTVTFAPTAVTSYGGTVTVNSDKTSGTNTRSCSGTGTNEDKPTVTVTATDSSASEPGTDTGGYRISRTDSTASSLSVYFAMSGSATNGTDYNTISSPKTIPAGSSYVDITLTPKDDSIYEGDETAVLTISTNSAYDRGSPYSATVTIQDIDCTYSIDPTSEHFSSSGGAGNVSVTTESGCDWSATSNDGWITITSGSSGSGDGAVDYSVSSNSSISSRTGTMTIAGLTFTVTQDVGDIDNCYVNKDDFTCGGNGPCYSNIQEAIDAAGSLSTIKVVQGFYDEDVTLNTSKTLALQGGWDSTFTTQSSNTTINSLTVSSGTIVPSNIILQPAGATIVPNQGQ